MLLLCFLFYVVLWLSSSSTVAKAQSQTGKKNGCGAAGTVGLVVINEEISGWWFKIGLALYLLYSS